MELIMEDKLGFRLNVCSGQKMGIEQYRWPTDIESFVGAIAGKVGKGLIVTTAASSRQAIEYTNNGHINLMDGRETSPVND